MTIKHIIAIAILCLTQAHALADSLIFAVHPYLPALELQKRFTPLTEHLSRSLGREVKLKISPSYEDHMQRITRGQVDIAYLGPASFVKAYQAQPGLETLARLEVNGQPVFHGKIITRHDSGIQSLQELEGKRFAFGNKNSTMSHLVPRHMLEQHKIFDKLSDYSFLGGHNDVALGVLIGQYDAGAIKEGVYVKYRSKGLKLIQNTMPISEHLFVASHLTPQKLCISIRESLLEITRSADGADILQSIKPGVTNLVAVTPVDYSNLQSIMKTISTLKE